MDAWPAMSHERGWRNLEYLRRIGGFRTVPIEVSHCIAIQMCIC